MRAARGLWISPGARVSIVVLFALMLTIGAANILFTTTQVDRLRMQQQAACAVAADVGTAPLQSSPKPGKLGVTIVLDFRRQWRTLHCPGSLPAPPGLQRWAAYYHLPAS